ncbi:hypothetical protein KVR01_010929 [Diaporthe batatas]|uniref:uncharacterized protein n=1 Tax=Diaporthe batatas TaxID=748121 RepID=UPI001D049F0B|nr:uncharacterized protein KVR01_010929 [Diaporthe batatas]KAG8159268.1 hypothetical protein KVR01_010929 [Diaporthe batatas]
MAAGLPRGPFGRLVLVAAALVFLFSFAHYMNVVPESVRLTSSTPEGPNKTPVKQQDDIPDSGPEEAPDYSAAPQCIPELDHLKKPELGLTTNIKFTRRCIKPVFSTSAPQSSPADPNAGAVDRDVVANISQPILYGPPVDVNLLSCGGIADDYIPCEPLKLAVPDPYPERVGQYDHLLFAVATSSERLKAAKPHFAHWMAKSGSPLIALLTDRPGADQTQKDLEVEQATTWPSLIDDFASSGIELLLVRPHGDHSVAQSHMMVILDMLAHVRARRTATASEYTDEGFGLSHNDTHWLGILDDDTFLPAIEPLSAALAAHDHTKPAYLGDLSESFAATRFGMAAFGGAGIFLSVPLAEELEPHLGNCLSGRGGDMQLMECIHDHTHARLERVKGLMQQDMKGNLDGFFESGWRFITLHHWKSWYSAPILDMGYVALVCGGCFLQRWKFPDFGNKSQNGTDVGGLDSEDGTTGLKAEVIFTNGYSIVRYPNGAPELSLMEGTWDGAETKDFRWSLGPIRPQLGKEDKKTWRLAETVKDEKKGSLTQIYVFKDEGKESAVDEVIELIWDPR